MSLDLRIGPFVLPRLRGEPDERETVEILDRRAEAIARLLRESLSMDYDPRSSDESAPNSVSSLGPVSNLHALRGLARELEAAGSRQEAPSPRPGFAHLLNHSDADGYYLPVDLPEPFWITIFRNRTEANTEPPSFVEEPLSAWRCIRTVLSRKPHERPERPEDVVSVGSSVGLLRELGYLENAAEGQDPRMGSTFDALLEAAELSVERGLPIELC